MAKSAIPVGIIFLIFGIFLLIITKLNIVGLIYGIISIIIGVGLIIFWNQEDIIEERKDIKTK